MFWHIYIYILRKNPENTKLVWGHTMYKAKYLIINVLWYFFFGIISYRKM